VSDALLALLRYCFLALLFVFLGRVVFVVIREIRASRAPVGEGTATAAESTARARRTRDWRVVVIEPKAQAGREYVLAAENTVGRAAGCTISLEDEFVSTIHLRLFTADGALYAEDSASTNGTIVNGDALAGTRRLTRGDRIGLGGTVLEVRR
jgi:hypothetical protein